MELLEAKDSLVKEHNGRLREGHRHDIYIDICEQILRRSAIVRGLRTGLHFAYLPYCVELGESEGPDMSAHTTRNTYKMLGSVQSVSTWFFLLMKMQVAVPQVKICRTPGQRTDEDVLHKAAIPLPERTQ
jgi:hypothetical protein